MLGKLTTTLLLLTAAAAPSALVASSHVHIHVKSTTSTSNASTSGNTTVAIAESVSVGSAIAKVEAVDAAQYTIKACAPQSWNITSKNATSVWLDFASINAPGDMLVVSALNGSHPQVFSVAQDGVSTTPIAGKGVRIEFRPLAKDVSSTGCATTGKVPSFTLKSVGYGMPKGVTKEEVCGKNELISSMCFSDRIGAAEKAVLRLWMPRSDGVHVCTGWLWGNKGHVITNNHCIASKDEMANVKLQFDVAVPCSEKGCDPTACPVRDEVSGKYAFEFIMTDKNLDLTLLQITKDPNGIVKKYGYLKLRDGEPKAGESIFIVQHPHGQGRQVAVDSSLVTNEWILANPFNLLFGYMDRLKAPTISSIKRLGTKASVVEYMADTEHGSSGSPVLAAGSKTVVGLHHKAGCPNRAIASNLLADKLRNIGAANDGLTK